MSSPSNLVFQLYIPYYSFNLGHLLWDDALALFSMLDTFRLTGLNEDDPDITPLPFYVEMKSHDPFYRCNVVSRKLRSRWDKCTKMYNRIFPSVFRYQPHKSGDILRTGTWLRGMSGVKGGVVVNTTNTKDDVSNAIDLRGSEDESGWNQMLPNATLVLLPTVLAGIGKHGETMCNGDCALHRSSQLFSFRSYLLRNIFYPNYESISKQPPAGYITFSLPGGSSRPDEVSFFENIIPIAKELYGEEKVKVVDMAKLSTYQEEAHLAINTAVFFVNHGGGSSTSIFLPWGSSAFLYTGGPCKSKSVYSCDKDTIFYSTSSYIRPTWIHANELDDVVRITKMMQSEYKKTMESWIERGIHTTNDGVIQD